MARALALRTGDAVLQVRRVLSFRGAPTILEDLWLPGAPFKGLTAERLAGYHGPMYALFETEFGVRMIRAEEKIRAVLPDAAAGRAARSVDAATPLLSVERVAYTYDDTPMELRRGLYRTDTHHYRNELELSAQRSRSQRTQCRRCSSAMVRCNRILGCLHFRQQHKPPLEQYTKAPMTELATTQTAAASSATSTPSPT